MDLNSCLVIFKAFLRNVCICAHFVLLKHFAMFFEHFVAPKLPRTMDARSTAAVRAVHLVVNQANDAAVADNVRLRRAVERARRPRGRPWVGSAAACRRAGPAAA